MLLNSPFSCNFECLTQMLEMNDALVALQDGVLISLKNNIFFKQQNINSTSLYVLEEDIVARGLESYVSSKFSLIGYEYLVHLTTKHVNQMMW